MKLGLDIGFSYTKWATSENDFNKVITAVAEVKGYHITTGNDIYEFEGRHYYVGEKALKQPNENIIDISNYEMLEYFSPLIIAHVLNTLKTDDVKTLCLGLSPSHILYTDRYRQRCSNFSVNGKKYDFALKDIKIVPQGLGAIMAIESRGLMSDSDILLIDGGFNTVDTLFIYDKEVQVGRLSQDNAFEGWGVVKVAQKLIEKIASLNIGITLSTKEAQQILNTRRLKYKGKEYDLSHLVDEAMTEYTKELMAFIDKKYGGDMVKMDSVYVVGGLAYLIDKNIEGYEEGFIKTFEDTEYLNAIGNYLKIKGK